MESFHRFEVWPGYEACVQNVRIIDENGIDVTID